MNKRLTKTLGEVCEFHSGLWKGKKPPYVHVGVIRNTNFTKDGRLDEDDIAFLDVELKQFDNKKLKFGDIILEKSGGGPKQPVGRVIIFEKTKGQYSFSNFTSAVRVKDQNELNYKYLQKYLWFLHSSGITEKMQKHSTGIRNLQMKEYKEVVIPLPSLPEQKRLVSILDEAFAAIEKAKENAKKNLQNAQEIFESCRKSTFADGGKRWIKTKIGEQIKLQRGFDITKKQQRSGKVPVVSSGGIKSFHDTAMAKAPGVVIGRKGTLGKVFYLENDFWPHDTTLWVKEFKENNPRFVYHFLMSLDVAVLNSGTANPALNRNLVHSLEVLWPPLDLQTEIVSKFDILVSETKKLQSLYTQKLSALDELKQSLLKKAFSGEL